MFPSIKTKDFLRCGFKFHLICGLCAPTHTKKCTTTLYECTVTSQLLDKLKLVLCQFKSNGCQEIFDHEQMLEHEAECQFRFVECFFSYCKEIVMFSNCLTHYRTKHPLRTADLIGNKHKIIIYDFVRVLKVLSL